MAPIGQKRKQEAAIVLIGDFNPKIFHPTWFSREELIKKQDEEDSKIEIIRPELVSIDFGWMKLQVTRDRFQVSTLQEPYYEPMRDLVIGTFNTLSHTPIKMLGINSEVHYLMPNEAVWHALGDKLAPKSLWNNILAKPGLSTMTMEGKREDGYGGFIHVRVGPSSDIKPGVVISINDHLDLSPSDGSLIHGANEIISALEKNWVPSQRRASTIFEEIIRGAE